MTEDRMINSVYNSIKHALDAQGIPNDVPDVAMEMVINDISIGANGERTITYTCYRYPKKECRIMAKKCCEKIDKNRSELIEISYY